MSYESRVGKVNPKGTLSGNDEVVLEHSGSGCLDCLRYQMNSFRLYMMKQLNLNICLHGDSKFKTGT